MIEECVLLRDESHVPGQGEALACLDEKRSQGAPERADLCDAGEPLHDI